MTTFIPDEKFIKAIKKGKLAPNCTGGEAKVEKVIARGADEDGSHWVAYKSLGPDGWVNLNTLNEGLPFQH